MIQKVLLGNSKMCVSFLWSSVAKNGGTNKAGQWYFLVYLSPAHNNIDVEIDFVHSTLSISICAISWTLIFIPRSPFRLEFYRKWNYCHDYSQIRSDTVLIYLLMTITWDKRAARNPIAEAYKIRTFEQLSHICIARQLYRYVTSTSATGKWLIVPTASRVCSVE